MTRALGGSHVVALTLGQCEELTWTEGAAEHGQFVPSHPAGPAGSPLP